MVGRACDALWLPAIPRPLVRDDTPLPMEQSANCSSDCLRGFGEESADARRPIHQMSTRCPTDAAAENQLGARPPELDDFSNRARDRTRVKKGRVRSFEGDAAPVPTARAWDAS